MLGTKKTSRDNLHTQTDVYILILIFPAAKIYPLNFKIWFYAHGSFISIEEYAGFDNIINLVNYRDQ